MVTERIGADPVVSLKGVSFSYKNPEKTYGGRAGAAVKPVLSDFSLEVYSGEAVAVMGESGSGKTTLVRLLLGLIKPDVGTVAVQSGAAASVVFQEDRLLPWYSARENVELVIAGASADRRTVRALASAVLEEVELSEAADRPIRELSGGMQRRVAIARALAYGGSILLLDEPLKGLDDEMKKRIVPRILARFPTVLLITHSPDEAALFGCKRVYNI